MSGMPRVWDKASRSRPSSGMKLPPLLNAEAANTPAGWQSRAGRFHSWLARVRWTAAFGALRARELQIVHTCAHFVRSSRARNDFKRPLTRDTSVDRDKLKCIFVEDRHCHRLSSRSFCLVICRCRTAPAAANRGLNGPIQSLRDPRVRGAGRAKAITKAISILDRPQSVQVVSSAPQIRANAAQRNRKGCKYVPCTSCHRQGFPNGRGTGNMSEATFRNL